MLSCQDIDECATGRANCFGADDQCVNTRGSYRCETVTCPRGFIRSVTVQPRSKYDQLNGCDHLPLYAFDLLYCHTRLVHVYIGVFTSTSPLYSCMLRCYYFNVHLHVWHACVYACCRCYVMLSALRCMIMTRHDVTVVAPFAASASRSCAPKATPSASMRPCRSHTTS